MTATEYILRIAAGSGLHASLLLIFPFGIDASISPMAVFLVLAGIYVIFVFLGALIGAIAFLVVGGKDSLGDQAPPRPLVLFPAVASGLLYSALPASLAFSWGITGEVVTISVLAFLLGFFLQVMFIKIAFAEIFGRVVISFLLVLPVFLSALLAVASAG
jgi:hypothetical protein